MKNDEELELKMGLFDVISETKDSLNISEIKKETDFLFEFCKNLTNVREVSPYQKDELLKANLYSAISSYYLSPSLDMENRIPFINGIIYASESIAMCDSHFETLTLEEKMVSLYEQFSLMSKEVHMEKDYLSYVKIGIAAELKMHEANKGKK